MIVHGIRWGRFAVSFAVMIVVLFAGSCGGGSSSGGGGSNPGALSLSINPPSPTMLAGSTLTVSVVASELGVSATPSVTSAQLPAGITTTTSFPLPIAPGGTALTLQTATNLAAGSYKIVLTGVAGSVSATADILITVQTNNLPAFYFTQGLYKEVALPVGGSGQIQISTGTNGVADYNVILSANGLPPGTSSTITPSTITPGQTAIVTITASSTAPFSQNVSVTVTGTPEAPIPAASTNFLASVTPAQNSLPNNRTDYLSTEATPYAAVYDPIHELIFSSNNSWNRVDIISNTTHAIVKSVPIRDPRGIDITQDASTVWVATGSQQVFGINTTTFAATRYQLPGMGAVTSSGAQIWQGNLIYALADGTFFIYPGGVNSNTFTYFAIWNPASNILTPIKSPPNAIPGIVQRTGDGKRVYSIGGNSFYYDDVAGKFSGVTQLGAFSAATNFDGSRIAVYDGNSLNMYDGNFNPLGPLPGGGLLGGLPFEGGLVFSSNTGYLYETAVPTDLPFIITIDPNTLQALSIAPAMGIPGGENSPDLFIPTPFAVDSTGIVLGFQPYGIAFDDATFSQNFSSSQPGFPPFLNHMSPYVGPLAGGTTSGGFGNAFNITPGIWYGKTPGTANNTSNDLTITSPASSTPGPVNIKFIFPDGMEVFDPLFFSYGPSLQHAVLSGASPEGGAVGQVAGFGLPSNSSEGTLTVGGVSASIINPPSFGAPTTGAPFPTSTILSFTVPAVSPGSADVIVNSPNGQSTLPKGIFYAQSVTDYSSPDSFTAVLYDAKRQQLYLSAGNHVDVFSLSSNEFGTPLTPPAIGSSKEFAGLALTPDSSLLLATDLLDGSLAVMDPDNPNNSYAIPVVTPVTSQGCTTGPLYVASSINSLSFVQPGGLPGTGCGPGGSAYQVNLNSKSSGFVSAGNACLGVGSSLSSTSDGTTVVFGGDGFCVYNAASQTFAGNNSVAPNSVTISADGNVAAAQWVFLDATPNVIGRVALPDVYYVGYSQDVSSTFYLLEQPKLNDSGSLYYLPYPNFFDIVDVQHGTLRMLFSLTENISNTAVPMAIDSGGRYIYLLTNKGLTIVDLGNAPLSIGSLSLTTVSPGTAVTVRGSGFTASTTATIGGQNATVTFIDQNTLTVTVPTIPAGPADVTLQNTNAISYT